MSTASKIHADDAVILHGEDDLAVRCCGQGSFDPLDSVLVQLHALPHLAQARDRGPRV